MADLPPRTLFDRSFQKLFTVIQDVVDLYRQKELIDGVASSEPRLLEVRPSDVEENTRAYKEQFDKTGPDMHVDVVLELYSKFRVFLHRGYQCDSWLREKDSTIYYGVNIEESGQRQLNLDCVFLMLEALKRASSDFRTQASVLRVKFSYQIYAVFVACLNYNLKVDNNDSVRGVPDTTATKDLALMESLQNEILNDIPKPVAPAPAAPSGPSNPLSAIASMFPGGVSDIFGSFAQALPTFAKTVTENVARMSGTQISESEQSMIDSTVKNIQGYIENPDKFRSLMSEVTSSPDGIPSLISKIMAPSSDEPRKAEPAEPHEE